MDKKPNDNQSETDRPVANSHNVPAAHPKEAAFPIVGIGASAGGLEALLLFFKNVPRNSGMAFIVVQHMDPAHKGFLVDLLMRATTMQVFQVQDGLPVKPDCVYVIPPNKNLQLFHKTLHLFDPIAPRGLRLPVDFLFRSMADDLQRLAIVVILSGMGSDGTQGMTEVKEKGGMVFVQDPAQAKFDGMPTSAINTGIVDEVALAEELPNKIIDCLMHKSLGNNDQKPSEKAHNDIEKIVILLRSQTGNDFSQYKTTTVYRRILRRMAIHQIEKLEYYVRFLQENPQEMQILFKELLIGVTSFFRDPEAWQQLKEQIFPKIFKVHSQHKPLRVWVVGCSTGEEAYSLAIAFKEALENHSHTASFQLQIFATDLDSDAINIARQGLYADNITANVSPDRLNRFFTKETHGYRIKKELRSMVVFAPQNVAMDPPFTKIDLLSCRNLLIYLTPTLQHTLLNLFHYSLNPDGFLFLGSAETAHAADILFEPLKGSARLYKRRESQYATEPFHFPFSDFHNLPIAQGTPGMKHTERNATLNLENLTNQLILDGYSPAAVLVNDTGDILYTKGNTGKYLQPASGKANWNIFAMARKGLYSKLHRTFQKAVNQKITMTVNDVVLDTDVGKQAVDVIIQPLEESETLHRLLLVVFTNEKSILESKAHKKSPFVVTHKSRVIELEEELESVRLQLQNLLVETQTHKEDFLSTYEELQSTNEELQSTSEEITTSKEELQSLNEELQTVNYELLTKVDEMNHVNDDMKNLLDSTDIATLFLDKLLHIRRYTPSIVKIINLIPGDIGRPFTDIATKLNYPELAEDTRTVLEKLVQIEKSISTTDGHWFQIRIMPYITADERPDGLVITFMDTSVSKKLEIALRQIQADMQKHMDLKGSPSTEVEETADETLINPTEKQDHVE
ncbi:MAG: chemotaxis protein CheB [Clostridia bacterium]